MRTGTQEKDDDCKYRGEWWWLQGHKILGRLSFHPACCLFSASPTSHLLSQKCTTPPRDAIINLSCHHFIQSVSLSNLYLYPILIFIFISNFVPAVTEVHNPSKRCNHKSFMPPLYPWCIFIQSLSLSNFDIYIYLQLLICRHRCEQPLQEMQSL